MCITEHKIERQHFVSTIQTITTRRQETVSLSLNTYNTSTKNQTNFISIYSRCTYILSSSIPSSSSSLATLTTTFSHKPTDPPDIRKHRIVNWHTRYQPVSSKESVKQQKQNETKGSCFCIYKSNTIALAVAFASSEFFFSGDPEGGGVYGF